MASLKNALRKVGTLLRGKTSGKPDNRIFRGYFDDIRYKNKELIVAGWVLSQNGPYDELILTVNGIKQFDGEIVERPDVGQGLPEIPRSNRSGFRFRSKIGQEYLGGMVHIRISCQIGKKEIDCMETGFYMDMYTDMPAPPPHLIARVDGSANREFYLLKGAQNYREFLHWIETYSTMSEISTLLDWGCGSGRLTGFFLKYSGISDIHGCDIDAEAIAWAKDHFSQGTFSTIPLHPPTQYKANQFDLIISFSVLTHLERENQNAWLEEMRRILKPGALFLATVHGLKAAQVILPKEEMEKLQRDGVHDSMLDTVLEGVAPADYYRASFQSREYIQTHWSKFFEIVDFIEQGASNYHDIVIMRKHA